MLGLTALGAVLFLGEKLTKGWIKLHRKFLDWGWYKHSDTKSIFIHLLLIANNQDNEWNNITVKRGQTITSLPHLSRDTGISIQSIRTCLNRLKSTGEITDKSTNKYRIITIINYDTYQSQKETINRQINNQTNRQSTGNQQATNSKQEVKKERSKEKKIYNIPPSLSEVQEYCKQRSNNIDPQKFVDYYEARGWLIGKVKMKNWQAAIRTWEQRGDNNSTQKTDIPRYVPSAEDKAQWRM